MGLFSFFKKTTGQETVSTNPYKDSSVNQIYNLLFCDNIELFKNNRQPPYSYPFDILLSDTSTIQELQTIIDNTSEARVKLLAYNQQCVKGHKTG